MNKPTSTPPSAPMVTPTEPLIRIALPFRLATWSAIESMKAIGDATIAR